MAISIMGGALAGVLFGLILRTAPSWAPVVLLVALYAAGLMRWRIRRGRNASR